MVECVVKLVLDHFERAHQKAVTTSTPTFKLSGEHAVRNTGPSLVRHLDAIFGVDFHRLNTPQRKVAHSLLAPMTMSSKQISLLPPVSWVVFQREL